MQSCKALGAFYTNENAADWMADWAIRSPYDTILEPCFGDGVFLDAIAKHVGPCQYFGVEIDKTSHSCVIAKGKLMESRSYLGDFLQTSPLTPPFGGKVTVVIGNPPYVRLRHMHAQAARTALKVARFVMGSPMQPSGSLWMPFVLHSCTFLHRGGRLAFVLPYELTYVQYAHPLWAYLGKNFGFLKVVRVHERLFPELMQEVVLFLADRFGESTSTVIYETYHNVNDLWYKLPISQSVIDLKDVIADRRPFARAILPQELRELLDSPRINEKFTQIGQVCKFGIGYVTGDKTFFHPGRERIFNFNLPTDHLLPAIATGRQLRGLGLYTKSLPKSQWTYLYDPPADMARQTEGDRRYIEFGELGNVHRRYKCRVREPWYKVPGLEKPDIILSVFSNRPLMILNDAGFLASNSLLCGKLQSSHRDARQLAVSWYNSLTLLSCELEVHSLGGGVMVLIPGEANKVLIPRGISPPNSFYEAIDSLLRHQLVDHAYTLGDSVILQELMGLTEHEVKLVRQGVDALRYWRTGFKVKKAEPNLKSPGDLS